MTAALTVEARSFCHLQCKLLGRLVEAGKFDKCVMRMALQVVEGGGERVMTKM